MFCMLSCSIPAIFRTYERTRRVGNLACVASCASLGQCWYMVAILVVCACAIYPLSVDLFRVFVLCSIPICVALSFVVVYPRPISVAGLCIASVGKLRVRPVAFLAALFNSVSVVSSCLSVNMPKWVAWFLDFRRWFITRFFLLGESNLFVRTLASFLTSVVICLRR